jgi:hypothetical protein
MRPIARRASRLPQPSGPRGRRFKSCLPDSRPRSCSAISSAPRPFFLPAAVLPQFLRRGCGGAPSLTVPLRRKSARSADVPTFRSAWLGANGMRFASCLISRRLRVVMNRRTPVSSPPHGRGSSAGTGTTSSVPPPLRPAKHRPREPRARARRVRVQPVRVPAVPVLPAARGGDGERGGVRRRPATGGDRRGRLAVACWRCPPYRWVSSDPLARM